MTQEKLPETSDVIPTLTTSFSKSKPQVSAQSMKPFRRWWLMALLALVLIAFLIVGGYVSWYLASFEATAKENPEVLVQTIRQGLNINPYGDDGIYYLLVLGLDSIEGQREGSLLTDTIMLIAVHERGDVRLLSVPRDLWVESLQTKVNALYYYGEQEAAGEGELLVTDVLADVMGIVVDDTLVVKTQDVVEIIDILGGIEVTVENGFVDETFPRADVDPRLASEKDLYMRVEFDEGLQHMDGERALIFMRSRHSSDETEGTDLARSQRQQLVLSSLMRSMMDAKILFRPETLGKLYDYYLRSLDTGISMDEMVGLVKHMKRITPTISHYRIPVTDNEVMGILYHPQQFIQPQWVYLPYDRSYQELHRFTNSVMVEEFPTY